MSTVKSFSVGNGDMFYIRHNSDNFSIIDCCLSEDNENRIILELITESADKDVWRFISTHPDDDHFRGIKKLDERLGIRNFYCVDNDATKDEDTEDFVHYCSLRDSDKAFHIERGCSRRWMNLDDETRKEAGINIVWPRRSNEHFEAALEKANEGGSPNNISAVIKYNVVHGARFLWMGDLETDFMEKIADAIEWPKVDIVFAPHHGRESGRIPHAILDQLKPKIIVIGEALSRHLHYYGGYRTLTQNTAGDLTFVCKGNKVHIFASNSDYEVDHLDDEEVEGDDYYIGTLDLDDAVDEQRAA
jgi:beta-lactamase superfamily II metal-dependent hydrolase